ncbi:Integrase catalytic region (fragment) [Magnetospirillum sp. UT-4]
MGIHKNARQTPAGREVLVRRVLDEGQTPMAVATAMGVCVRTVRKWVRRFSAEGVAGLQDRSSRPHRTPRQTPAHIAEQIATLRRQRRTGGEIATALGLSRATVFRTLARLGMNRLKSLEPAEPVRRYERDAPGEMIHIDIKKLGRFAKTGHRITGQHAGHDRSRGAGWEFVHVCIDDASRIAFTKIMADEKKESAVAFPEAALAYDASLGMTGDNVMRLHS